jgi:hypothetical protein
MKKLRIGSGAGYAGDRLEPAVELIEKGQIDYIGFECLAERTIAIAQQEKMKNPEKGYNHLLEYRMEKVLPAAYKNKVKIITNMGAANPVVAMKVIKEIGERHKLSGLKIAAVMGDNVFNNLNKYNDYTVWETGTPLKALEGEVVSANAYLGIEGIVQALKQGADVVITGRVSDPALFLAPLVYEFGWDVKDYDKMGKGTIVGHLLECAGQVTGGYYAEPGKKDIADLWNLGFPIAEVSEKGDIIITKLKDAGGKVTMDTCKEQIIYEIHDPENYMTPDCIADFSKVKLTQLEEDVVLVEGVTGKPETDTYKSSLGYKDCFIGEGEMSYGGPNCLERAKLALDIVKKRLEITGVKYDEIKFDIIGVNSLFFDSISEKTSEPREARIRVAARTKNREEAVKIGNEVETLYTNGPAGGGGATRSVSEIISVASILVPKEDIKIEVEMMEVQ